MIMLTITITMDAVIHNAIQSGAKPNKLIKLGNSGRYYFFFCQEIDNYDVPRRHAVPNKGTIFDYIQRIHYKSLAEWASANGRKVHDICYGVNYDDPDMPIERVYVSIFTLLKKLDPTWAEDTQVVNIHEQKRMKDIENCVVLIQNQVNNLMHLLNKKD